MPVPVYRGGMLLLCVCGTCLLLLLGCVRLDYGGNEINYSSLPHSYCLLDDYILMTAYYVSLFVRNNLNFKEIDRECRVTLYELYKQTKTGSNAFNSRSCSSIVSFCVLLYLAHCEGISTINYPGWDKISREG